MDDNKKNDEVDDKFQPGKLDLTPEANIGGNRIVAIVVIITLIIVMAAVFWLGGCVANKVVDNNEANSGSARSSYVDGLKDAKNASDSTFELVSGDEPQTLPTGDEVSYYRDTNTDVLWVRIANKGHDENSITFEPVPNPNGSYLTYSEWEQK